MKASYSTTILNELIQINFDRIAGYRKAIGELKEDNDLRPLFENVINQSHGFIAELKEEVYKIGGSPSLPTSIPGRLYHALMDIKITFGLSSRNSILDSCKFGEHIAKEEYRRAFSNEALTSFQRQMVLNHEKGLTTIRYSLRKLQKGYKALSAA